MLKDVKGITDGAAHVKENKMQTSDGKCDFVALPLRYTKRARFYFLVLERIKNKKFKERNRNGVTA